MPDQLTPDQYYSESEIESVLKSGSCKLTAQELGGIEIASSAYRTALHVAAEKGLLDQIKGLVTADDLSIHASHDGYYPLNLAAIHGHLKRKANVGELARCASCDALQNVTTALQQAVEFGHEDQIDCNETAEELSKICGADSPAIIYVAKLGLFHLVKNGVTVDHLKKATDLLGKPALNYAAGNGHLEKLGVAITCQDLASVCDSKGRTALHEAASAKRLNQGFGPVTGNELASVKDCQGVTALHTAAMNGALHQVDGLDMNLLANTLDGKGLSVLCFALEYLNPLEYNLILGLKIEELPENVIMGGSKRRSNNCLLQTLLTTKELPKGFVLPRWLELAEQQGKGVRHIDRPIVPEEMDRFMKNVDPELMVLYRAEAKFVAEHGSNKVASTIWLTNVMMAKGRPNRQTGPGFGYPSVA